MPGATRRIIERRKLRRRLLETLDAYPLVLLVAPPVSGKTMLLAQIAADLRERGDSVAEGPDSSDSNVTLLDRFDSLPGPSPALEVERRIAEGGRVILDTAFPRLRLSNQVREFRLPELSLRQDDLTEFLGADPGDDKTERDIRALFDEVGGWIGAWNVVKAQAYLRVAISERAIVEVGVKGMTLRFLPPEYVDLDRKMGTASPE